MSEYTPTVAFAEREYVTGRIRRAGISAREARAEHARMIAEVERAAAVRALEEGADGIFVQHSEPDTGKRMAFNRGADAVYDALRARAAEIREGKSE